MIKEQQQASIAPSSGGGKRVFLETFGCQMNELDSELVAQSLHALGYRFTTDWKQADVVLYNTCSVRAHAEAKVYSRIGQVAQRKQHKPDIVLGVIGCMAERDGRDLVRRYPSVDLLCGPGELDKLPLLIDNHIRTNAPTFALQGNTSRRSATLAAADDALEYLDLARAFNPDVLPGPSDEDASAIGGDAAGLNAFSGMPGASTFQRRSAYVRITRGCNKFCTYCVVPFTRGAEIHRPPSHIIDECKRLADAGVIEVTLLGQTVNHYRFEHAHAQLVNGVEQPQKGRSFKGGHDRDPFHDDTQVTTFARLLKRIHDEVPGIQRLRFVTSYPRDFGNDVLEIMRDCERLCPYVHVPAQSGSNRMLKMMNRGYTVEEYKDFISRVREYLPNAMIAGDFIVGFPTETDADFEQTVDLVKWVRYKNAFIFKYSPRPGTVAWDRLEDDVPEAVKKARNNALLAVQGEISAEIHAAQVGRRFEVFVEGVSSKERRRRKSVAAAGGGASAGADNGRGAGGIGLTVGGRPLSSNGDHGSAVAVLDGTGDGADAACDPHGVTSHVLETEPDHGAADVRTAFSDSEATEDGAGENEVVQLSGRTAGDLIVVFDVPASRADRMVGELIPVEITGNTSLTLFGRLAE
ncbi:MAG: MiaB/RimO family radical SAM methylthiotransferase [Planctomycetota bacterium]